MNKKQEEEVRIVALRIALILVGVGVTALIIGLIIKVIIQIN